MRSQKERVRLYFENDRGWKGRLYLSPDNRFARAIVRRKVYALEAIRKLKLPAGSVAIDVGCGSGMYLGDIAEEGFRVYGVDYSGEMVAICREKFSRRAAEITVLQGDVEYLPFDDAIADLVLCIGVFGYLSDDARALAEVSRVVRPGGFLLVNIENALSLSNIDYVARRRIRSMFSRDMKSQSGEYSFQSPWVTEHSPTSHRYRLFHPRKFERLLKEYGYSPVNARTFGFEFRLLRRSGIFPESLLDWLEICLEQYIAATRIPFFRFMGETYTGLFRRNHQ